MYKYNNTVFLGCFFLPHFVYLISDGATNCTESDEKAILITPFRAFNNSGRMISQSKGTCLSACNSLISTKFTQFAN